MKNSKQEIHEENWTYCQYRKGNLRGLVHLGAEWDDQANEPRNIYTVNVLDNTDQATQSTDFISLSNAIKHVNQIFQGRWQFEDLMSAEVKKASDASDGGSGCSSCQAH